MANELLEDMRSYLSYDVNTGVFTYTRKKGKMGAGKIAGTTNKQGHIEINFNQKKYQAHRVAWLFCNGRWPDGIIDHINRDPKDNRISNLRESTDSDNMHNRDKAHPINKTGLIGASFRKKTGKWVSQIRVNYKIFHIGVFDTPEEAHMAYMKEKLERHKSYKEEATNDR